MDDRAVTTYSIDCRYLTEEDNAEEREREMEEQGRSEEARRWDTRSSWAWTGRPGTALAHQVKCEGSGDPWIATGIAADILELGYGRSRVVLKVDQQVAMTEV